MTELRRDPHGAPSVWASMLLASLAIVVLWGTLLLAVR